MRIITKDPRKYVPSLMERDIYNKIVLVIENIADDNIVYIGMAIKTSEGNFSMLMCSITEGTDELWESCNSDSLINLLRKEYLMYGSICSKIVILESKRDVSNIIKEFKIKNTELLHLMNKTFS